MRFWDKKKSQPNYTRRRNKYLNLYCRLLCKYKKILKTVFGLTRLKLRYYVIKGIVGDAVRIAICAVGDFVAGPC